MPIKSRLPTPPPVNYSIADDIAPTKDKIQKNADTEANHKMPAGICPVGDYAVDEFGHSVNNTYQCQYYAEIRVRYAEFPIEGRHRESEVFTHKIEH